MHGHGQEVGEENVLVEGRYKVYGLGHRDMEEILPAEDGDSGELAGDGDGCVHVVNWVEAGGGVTSIQVQSGEGVTSTPWTAPSAIQIQTRRGVFDLKFVYFTTENKDF